MLPPLSCRQIREVDKDAVSRLGMPSLLLMENAARGVCAAVHDHGPRGSITIVCGPGNNGGDGLAVARLLAAESIDAIVLMIRGGKNLSDDARANLQFLANSGIQVHEPDCNAVAHQLAQLSSDDLIIDALLGTGIRGHVQPPFDGVIRAINASSAGVIAVDVPSGLDCDLGRPCGVCVRAQKTITFVAEKIGFQQKDATSFTGEIRVCHIGIPQQWLCDWFDRMMKSDP